MDRLHESVRLMVEEAPRAEEDPVSLEPLVAIGERGAACCVAAWVGAVRLIDNLRLAPPAGGEGRR